MSSQRGDAGRFSGDVWVDRRSRRTIAALADAETAVKWCESVGEAAYAADVERAKILDRDPQPLHQPL